MVCLEHDTFRICNFENAVQLTPNIPEVDLPIEECSTVYGAPRVLDFLKDDTATATLVYNPYKEDVFSLGLTFLQLALMLHNHNLKAARRDYKTLLKTIRELEGKYSNNLICLLMLMLKWDSNKRPDFLQLEQLYRDLMRMRKCDTLL